MSGAAAIAARAARILWRGTLGWAVLFGATVASAALTYVSNFPDAASRDRLAASIHANRGTSMLFGPISGIGTVGGYTSYKTFVFLTTLGAVWALLSATRLLRGEEDAGRWQLMVCGSTSPARATAAVLVTLGVAVSAVGSAGGVGALLASRDPAVGFGLGDCAGFAASLIVPMAAFAVVGALTSQFASTRRVASQVGLATIGIAFIVRMIADAGRSTRWALWLTPFGWSERIRALQAPSMLPIAVGGAAVLLAASMAIVLSARRDVGSGIVAWDERARAQKSGLGSVWGFAMRSRRGSLGAWLVGLVGGAAALGTVGDIASSAPQDSMSKMMEQLGAHGAPLREYYGVAFLLLGFVVALMPASVIGDSASDELDGRMVHLASRPVTRASLLMSQVVVTAGAIVVGSLAAGVTAFATARSRGPDVALATMLTGAANMVPAALVTLAIGAVLLAVAPRFAAPAVYAVVVWSFVVDLMASLVQSMRPIGRLSLFHWVPLVPAAPVDAIAVTVMLLTSVSAIAAAVMVFSRRDLSTG